MGSPKYKITVFKNRYQTTGTLMERTFEDIYFGFKHKVKRTKEKYAEYMNADKQTKATIKDVGGFIGGETEGNRRIAGVKIMRHLLTLDIDTKFPNVFPYLQKNIDFFCLVHSTHSHSPQENRFRIIAPLSRPVNADEYEALGRRLAYKIENPPTGEPFRGLFDETTFQANRLMFFPSVSADGEYICELLNVDIFAEQQKIIDVDEILNEYLDKNDIFEWFTPEKIDQERIGKNVLANKNPLKAKGMVGAFNRTYSVSQAIEKFLSDVYKKERNGRYTYLDGTSKGGGIILNNDTLFYSHHGTDPANLFYRSAFDLVRIHKFGKFDNKFTPERYIEQGVYEKTESFLKMVEFCRTLPEVVANTDNSIELVQRLEQEQKYIEEFFGDQKSQAETPLEEDTKWIVKLEGVKSAYAKLAVIFEYDSNLKNLLYYDTFRDNICFLRKPFWRKEFNIGDAITDRDMSHIRAYLDKVYGIKGERVIEDAVVVEADKIQKNKVLEYFESLQWDGKERLEFFFHDFFKVPLNPFTRVALKHWLVGAVSRIYKAGSPMDLVLVLKGEQGIGKSLFFKRLATIDFNKPEEHLYSDTKIDFNRAKDSYEQLEGIWIYEWKELAGMNMAEQESIKAFVDKTEDKFRRSYGRRNVEIRRRVVFGGTTNESRPLRDRTGNRRFMVIESPLKKQECYIKPGGEFTQYYKDQLIAEAIHLYKNGFDIFQWSDLELLYWERANEENLAENDFYGALSNYLNMERPKSWYSMQVEDMLFYLKNYNFDINKCTDQIWKGASLEPVDKVCMKELWQVALGQKDLTINRYHRDLIEQALKNLGWEITKEQRRFGVFGHQLLIRKKKENSDDLPF